MSTRHRPPMRTLVATLLSLALLLMLMLPYVDAAGTIALSKDVTLISRTLDDTVLDASAVVTAATTVNVLLRQCTVTGAGLNVSCAATADEAGSTAISMHIFDTYVTDATLAFSGYMPSDSDVRIVRVDATMEGTTPLFDLQSFYLNAGTGSSMTIQRVRATWGDGGGGSVVQISGPSPFWTLSRQIFSFSEAVVTGAAHVLEFTTALDFVVLYFAQGGLMAFDMVEFRDAKGAFVYSDAPTNTLVSSTNGMVRFSNITMTGDQPFLDAQDGASAAMSNRERGTMVFSAISNDGPLFSLATGAAISVYGSYVKYAFSHINVGSVLSAPTSYTLNIPKGYITASDPTWYFYMGNITVGGTLLDTIAELESNRLYATQLVGAYGEVKEVRQGDNWPTANPGDAAAVNCVFAAGVTADFVELIPGVNRAECNCPSGYHGPYCTTAVDPLVYYAAYSPSPAACDVVNCDACLFGQTSQCGACAFGYGLTASLGCDKIPCNMSNCNGCTTNNKCGACAEKYVLTATNRCAKCAVSHCTQCVAPGDGTQCAACTDGYKVNDKGRCKLVWWVWLIVGIAAAAVVAGIIVLVVCCVCRSKTKESSSSARASSNNAMRRDQSDATEMQRYGSAVSIGAAPLNRSAPSGAYQWSSADCNAGRTTQGSQVSVANPFNYDYQ